jgi:hypothetical protein
MHALANKDLIINSPFLLDEMADFERDHFIAKAKARHGKHDDRIMALLIGYWGAHDDEFLAGEDIGEERRLRKHAKTEQKEVLAPLTKRVDYQNTAITAKDAAAHADDWLFD